MKWGEDMNKSTKDFNKKWISKAMDLSKDLRSFYKGMTIIGLLFCLLVGYSVYDAYQKPKVEYRKTKYVLTKVMSTTKDPNLFWYMDALGTLDPSVRWFIDTPIHHNVQMDENLKEDEEHQFDNYLEDGVFDIILSDFAIYPYAAYYNKNTDFEQTDYKELGYDNDGYMVIEMRIHIGNHDTVIKCRSKENDKIEDIEMLDAGNMNALIYQK